MRAIIASVSSQSSSTAPDGRNNPKCLVPRGTDTDSIRETGALSLFLGPSGQSMGDQVTDTARSIEEIDALFLPIGYGKASVVNLLYRGSGEDVGV